MTYLDSPQTRWVAVMFVMSLLSIIALTLAPFNFHFESNLSFSEMFLRFSHRSSMNDWIVNILLYAPLGFSLAAWLWVKKASQSVQFAGVFFCAFALSTAVEVLQMFLESRISATTDIYANSVGGLLGLFCFNRWGQVATFDIFASIEFSIQRFIQQKIAPRLIQNLTFILLGYILLLFLISNSLQNTIHLRNWTLPYFLLVGNDQAIGSPWEGYVAEVSIAAQALSEKQVARIFEGRELPKPLQNSLVASYDLTSPQDSYPDETGNSPELIWHGDSTQLNNGNASLVNATQWLETEETVAVINKRISEASQFALSVVLATADVKQVSPAPIVSLSNQTSERRNLALVQQGSHLVLWLRTSVNDSEGTKPELVIPNFFTDTDFHHLIVTYDGSLLRVYVDNLQNQISFELNSGIVLFQKLLPLEQLKNRGLVVSKVLYYSLLFIPLGILTGLILIFTKRRPVYRMVLMAESVLLAPLALELLLMLNNHRELNWASFLLGAVLTATAILGVFIFRKL